MTDQLCLFSGSLMRIQQCKIKVKEGRLYADYHSTVIMCNKKRHFIHLSSTLYMLKLKVNLLSEKQMCKKDLQKSFDYYDLYMQNRHDRLILKVSEREEVYIVKHIFKNLDEFTLLSVMFTQHKLEVALSSTKDIRELMNSNETH